MNGHVPPESQDETDWKQRYELCNRHNEEITEELMQLRGKCAELSLEVKS